MAVAILVVAVLMIFVIPVFATMFENFGGQLPLPTRLVLALSTFVKKYLIFAIIGLVAAFIGVRYLRRSSNGKSLVDGTMLKLPIMGDLIRKQSIARFSRTLSTLLSRFVEFQEST